MKNLIIGTLLLVGLNVQNAKAEQCNDLAKLEINAAGAILDYSILADSDLLGFEKKELSELSKKLRDSARENALSSANMEIDTLCETDKPLVVQAVNSLSHYKNDNRATTAYLAVLKLAYANALLKYGSGLTEK